MKIELATGQIVSYLSGFSHLVIFNFRKFVSIYDKGMLIISIDVDVGSKELGFINQGKNDRNVSSRVSEYKVGELEELSIPQFVKLLDRYNLPVTLAIRGQLTELSESILTLLLSSPTGHEIGAHGYSHREFQSLTKEEAETELKSLSIGMKKFGLYPKSFIFPKNSVAHLEILEKYGYECYRDRGGLSRDSAFIKKIGNLWEIHPSLAIDRYTSPFLLKKILDIGINRKIPIHIWFHMRDFGLEPHVINSNLENILEPFFDYVKIKQKEGVLAVETMLSAARKASINGTV